MIPQIYVDLDGVLADFDTGYERAFGVRPDKVKDNVEWSRIAATPSFYADLPLMPDARELWGFVRRLKPDPIILTGIPSSVPSAATDKVGMVRRELDRNAKIICCYSREKCTYCSPGDILIDDWEKYQHLWLGAGGRWITHISAENSIKQLLDMGIGL